MIDIEKGRQYLITFNLNKLNILLKNCVKFWTKDDVEREGRDVDVCRSEIFIYYIKSYYILLYFLKGKHDDPLVRMILRQGEIPSVLTPLFSCLFLFFFSPAKSNESSAHRESRIARAVASFFKLRNDDSLRRPTLNYLRIPTINH